MKHNIILGLETWGKRVKVNKRGVAILGIAICLLTPGTNLFIPSLIKLKGVWYI